MEAGTAKGEAELRPGQGRAFACATRAPATRPNTELTLQISIQHDLFRLQSLEELRPREEVLMVCSALRGLFCITSVLNRTALKRPVDRYHPPSLRWGIYSSVTNGVICAYLYRSTLSGCGCAHARRRVGCVYPDRGVVGRVERGEYGELNKRKTKDQATERAID